MTIEQLLQNDAATLEAMSDDELKAFFNPYLIVTRPELATKPYDSKVFNGKQKQKTFEYKKNLAMEILKQAGISVKRW